MNTKTQLKSCEEYENTINITSDEYENTIKITCGRNPKTQIKSHVTMMKHY